MTEKKDDTARHIPVLPCEVLSWLNPCSGGSYADGTLGLGGHAELILRQSGPEGQLFGFEWDAEAAALAQKRLSEFGGRFRLISSSYAEMAARLRAEEIGPLNGILLDLGVSSLQFDSPERGFSFQSDAPLDMRMNRSLPVTAAEMLNRLSQDELADIFFHYGEERQARRIARFIAEARIAKPMTTTRQLAELVRQAIPVKYQPKKIHPATLVFQALRIAVNRELDNLAQVLTDAPQLLAPGGRLCIITFHSLEDRMVKQSFASNPALQGMTKKPVLPSAEEIAGNPRSRSAKLRVAEKI